MEEARSVWEGTVGDVPLKVEVQPSGRIAAQWRARGNDRRVVVKTVEELERSVLFQLMLTAPPEDRGLPQEIVEAVNAAKVGLPDPVDAPRPPRRRGRPPRRTWSRPRRR